MADSVVAFDVSARRWISSAEGRPGPATPVPSLDGELTRDRLALDYAATDFGHLVSCTPSVVLRPGSVADVEAMVRFARQHGLKIAVKGQGHGVMGRAMVEDGIVVDSRTLDRIEDATSDSVWAEAGVVWRDLVASTLKTGRVPPVLTHFLGLSVGGVLSVGGIGGATHRFGFVCDNVLELDVVTGNGERVCCSDDQNPELFRAVLGGLGQFAVILRARIRLIEARPTLRTYQLLYPSLATFIADQRRAVSDERFDLLEGQIAQSPDGSGAWIYVIEAGKWVDPADPPNDAALLGDLSPIPQAVSIAELPFAEWANRVDMILEMWHQTGVFEAPHPWSDLFLPDSSVESVVSETFAGITPGDIGPGVTLVYPFKRSKLKCPFVPVPNEEIVWLFDMLRVSTDPDRAQTQVASNRSIFERARDAQGKRYAISAIEFSRADWLEHFGDVWGSFESAKARFDPSNILTPGQKIFP
jgi:FAD/FMN-containing dehydrogenase